MIFRTIQSWQEIRKTLIGTSLGFIPTMGALHEGHLSLIRKSQVENQKTLVSIFVNPKQFNNPKDFETYPRTENEDLEILKRSGVDFIFLPKPSELYQDNYQFRVHETELSQKLCGKHRPGHFDGVLTVVLKLLNLAQASSAYFGEKDFQQYLLIKQMAESFFLSTKIIGLPTVREEDGLAMSSRNRLLTSDERKRAALLPVLLRSPQSITAIEETLKDAGFRVDYIEEYFGRRFGAVHIGRVRLIDNVEI
jgi:pantoate--beta-alanine ligase